jgi:uncharacterized protein (DUF2249 family)
MQSDMVDQATMVNRAQHLGVFEHLKSLQAQQREQLIKDQQDQWSKLQAGQRAAEARLVAQRQYQWGSKTSMFLWVSFCNCSHILFIFFSH